MFVSDIYDEVAEILGTTDQRQIFRKLSQAVQSLMESGHWFHTNSEVDICTGWDGQTITLPRDIEVPLAVNVDGSPQYFRNRFFQYHVNGGGMYNPVGWAWDDRGFVATMMDIRQPSQLVAVAESINDAGQILRIVGTDKYNRALRSQLNDGTGVDGILLPIHAQSDFAYGTLIPDGVTIKTRSVAVTPINTFLTSVSKLMSGQAMVLNTGGSSFPFLLNGNTYYVGNVITTGSSTSVQLFATALDAQSGTNPISLQSIPSASSTFTLTDSRPCNLLTTIKIATSGVPNVSLSTPNEVTFSSSGSGLPSPLVSGVTYFANQLTPQTGEEFDFQIYASLADATNGTNPVYLTGSLSSFNIQLRKAIAPESIFTFTVPHLFSSGDIVQAVTNNGTLPQPLLSNVNYYVHVITSQSISIHSNYADAIAGTNPIIVTTAGSGVNSFAKLIPATAVIGSSNNIQAPGFNLSAITANGSGAVVNAYASGGVTGTSYGTAGTYTVVPSGVTFNDAGGYGYSSTPTVTLSKPLNFTGTAATATPTLATEAGSGKKYISSISVVNSSGSGYSASNPPTVTITGGGGYGAVATAVVADGVISSMTKVTNGSGYTPVSKTITGVQISDSVNGNAIGATATVTTSASGAITSFILTSGGSAYGAYTNSSNLTLSGGSDPSGNPLVAPVSTQATFTNTVSNGAISSVNLQTIGNGASASVALSGTALSLTITSPGSGYIFPPRITFVGGTSTVTATFYSSITTTSVNNYFITNPGNGYTIPPAITVSNGGGTGATATTSINTGITSLNFSNNGSGYTANLTYTGVISATDIAGGGSGFSGLFSTNSSGVITNWEITNSGTGYINPTIVFSGAGTPGTAAVAAATYGTLVAVTPVALGNGYSANPTTTVTASTGVFVQFSSTGTLPSPLVSGTAYRAEAPDSTNSFTVKNTDFSQVNITDTGSGTFYLVVSRTFGLSFAVTGTVNSTNVTGTLWTGDFSSFYTPSNTATTTVYFASDYLSPPPMSAGTAYYLFPTSSTTAYIFTSGFLSGPPGTPITITSLGTGQGYYAIQGTATPVVYGGQIIPNSTEYLSTGETVTFKSTGTLPGGMNSGANYYTITVLGNSFTVSPAITYTSLGTGQLSANIVSTITVNASTSLTAAESVYETGTDVQVRANTGDVLPTGGIAASTDYYVRRLTNNTFSLYTTQAQSLAGGSTGLVVYTSTGNTVDSTFFTDAIENPTLVKTVQHVNKPITDGFVSLYALDNGRSNDMTLIGQYHPSETNPMYRRIRIGKPAAWARILYRVKAPTITSIYDYIPIEQPRAVITAVHAVDLEDKDFMDQATKYWAMALSYLKNQQNSMDGHAMQPPQINGITYGDRTDPVIDGGYFYY